MEKLFLNYQMAKSLHNIVFNSSILLGKYAQPTKLGRFYAQADVSGVGFA